MLFRLLIIVVLISSCKPSPPLDTEFALAGSSNITTLASRLDGYDATIILFLSPECPLCKNYAPSLREIKTTAQKHNIAMIGAVSGTFHTDTAISSYLQFYNLEIPVLKDPDFVLSKYYEATITPEVCFLNKRGEILYRGAIDNWAISLGQKRQIITEHYLLDAITAFAERRPIHPKTTKPVGCFIQ